MVQQDGAVYPSITRVLGSRPKPQLEAWKKKEGPIKSKQITKIAAEKGATIHTFAEGYVNNMQASVDAAAKTAPLMTRIIWSPLRDWINTHVRTVRGQEQNIYSKHLAVAGRFDLLATIDDDVLSLIDFKNSRRKRSLEMMQDYFLQGTFYSLAIYEHTGQKVKQINMPVTSPEGFQVFSTKPGAHYDALRYRIDEYYQLYHTEPVAV
mgnify:FL=1